jgi:CubicO group peptidase (beta-lactamase class C family)
MESLKAQVDSVMSEAVQFAGISKSGLVYSISCNGNCFAGSVGPVQSQLVHWGSCAKALAATVCAALIEQKMISFDSTLGLLLGKLEDPALVRFGEITVLQLLR